jgi:hypothetical protein
MINFLSMEGYGWYVWSALSITAVSMFGYCLYLIRRGATACPALALRGCAQMFDSGTGTHAGTGTNKDKDAHDT